jgi:hypothetical protein
LKAYPSNPAHDCVLILYMKMFMINNPIQFNLLDFQNSDINLDDIAPIVIPENPPWLNPKPTFIFELTQHKKSETNPLLIHFHIED